MGDTDDVPVRTFDEGYGDDPPASILTKAQREYFSGEREVDGAQERAMKRRIRERISAGLWDLLLLSRHYPDEEIGKIRPDTGEPVLPTPPLAAFLYRLQPENGAVDADFKQGEDPSQRDRRAGWVETDVEQGIRQVLRDREGIESEIDVSITVDRGVDLEEIAEQDLSTLSRDQLDQLLIAGVISNEEYGEAISLRLSDS